MLNQMNPLMNKIARPGIEGVRSFLAVLLFLVLILTHA